MGDEDARVRKDLEGLSSLVKSGDRDDLEMAKSRYGQYSDIRAQITKLSRENTNVRSLSLSLGQKRKAASVCQEELTALEQAIAEEPIAGTTYGAPVHPR